MCPQNLPRGCQVEESTEPAQLGVASGTAVRLAQRLNGLDERVAGINAHPRIGVADRGLAFLPDHLDESRSLKGLDLGVVGTLQDGYIRNVPLPRVPREQRASPELTAPKAGIPLPGYSRLPAWIPTLPKISLPRDKLCPIEELDLHSTNTDEVTIEKREMYAKMALIMFFALNIL